MLRDDVLYLIICGGPPAAEAEKFLDLAQDAGWDVCVTATPEGARFINEPVLTARTGHRVRSAYKRLEEPDLFPPPNAIVVAPATFNTMNKLVHGIADTLALSLLCEYLALHVPIVMAPNVNPALARHPEFPRTVEKLSQWGVAVVIDPSAPPPTWMVGWDRILNELGSPPKLHD